MEGSNRNMGRWRRKVVLMILQLERCTHGSLLSRSSNNKSTIGGGGGKQRHRQHQHERYRGCVVVGGGDGGAVVVVVVVVVFGGIDAAIAATATTRKYSAALSAVSSRCLFRRCSCYSDLLAPAAAAADVAGRMCEIEAGGGCGLCDACGFSPYYTRSNIIVIHGLFLVTICKYW
jgi:hypothetical protein